ncbi:MAG: hypothetical protein LBR89_00635, partial [Holosporales bacterium]|nr:hypothetical protein [Holosporales bacterium]
LGAYSFRSASQDVPPNVLVDGEGGRLVSSPDSSAYEGGHLVDLSFSGDISDLYRLRNSCLEYIRQKTFKNKNAQVVDLSKADQRDVYSKFASGVLNAMADSSIKVFNAHSYEGALNGMNISERALFAFLCGTTEMILLKADPNSTNNASADRPKYLAKTQASGENWIKFIEFYNNSADRRRQLRSEEVVPENLSDFILMALEQVLEVGDTSDSLARATEYLSKAHKIATGQSKTLGDLGTGYWQNRILSLLAFCSVGDVQKLSYDESRSFPAYKVHDWWPGFTKSNRCVTLCRNQEFACWMTLLGDLSGTKCEVPENQKKAFDIPDLRYSFRTRLEDASRQGDFQLVQKCVDLGLHSDSRDLVSACVNVSTQAANIMTACQEFAIKPANDPPSDHNGPSATDVERNKICNGIRQMRVPAWPVSMDFQRIITDRDLQMFMNQKVASEREKTYPAAGRGLRNMIAVIDMCLTHQIDGSLFDEDGHIAGNANAVSFVVTYVNEDDKDAGRLPDEKKAAEAAKKVDDAANYLQRLDQEFRSFLGRLLRPTLSSTDTNATKDRLTHMKAQLEELLQDNFEANVYSEKEYLDWRENELCLAFWGGHVLFDTRQDAVCEEITRSLTNIDHRYNYSTWGDTAVQRFEKLAKCIEAIRVAEPWKRWSVDNLPRYRMMVIAARTALLEFFSPLDGQKPTEAELRNMSPIARSTLAMFYFWYKVQHYCLRKYGGVACLFINTCDSERGQHTQIQEELELKYSVADRSEYAVALRKCMKGALPHLFPILNGSYREYFYSCSSCLFSSLVYYCWFFNLQHFYHNDKHQENPRYHYEMNIPDERYGEINRLFMSIFGGIPYSYNDSDVKSTYWEQVNDGDDAEAVVKSVDLFGCANVYDFYDESKQRHLRRVIAHGQNGVNSSIPPHVDVLALTYPRLCTLGDHNSSVDGLLARAISDPYYREFVARRIQRISYDDDSLFTKKTDFDSRKFGVEPNMYYSMMLDRCESWKNKEKENSRKSAREKKDPNYCRGAVTPIESLFSFRVISFCKELSQHIGNKVFCRKSDWSERINPKFVLHHRLSYKHAELEGPGSDGTDVSNRPFFLFCQQDYWVSDDGRLSVVPTFVEKEALDYSAPLRFDNNFVCVDDKPLWDTALTLARLYYAKIGKDKVPDIRPFIESCGISVNKIPRGSSDKDNGAHGFAKQIYKSQFVQDLYADVIRLANAYFKMCKYAAEGDFNESNFPGLSSDDVVILKSAIDDYDASDGDDELTSYFDTSEYDCCTSLPYIPKVYECAFKQVMQHMKTAHVWRENRCVLEALEALAFYELGTSFFEASFSCVECKKNGVYIDLDKLLA